MRDRSKPDPAFVEALWARVELEAFGPHRVETTAVAVHHRRGPLLAAAAAVVALMLTVSTWQGDPRAIERLEVTESVPTPSPQPEDGAPRLVLPGLEDRGVTGSRAPAAPRPVPQPPLGPARAGAAAGAAPVAPVAPAAPDPVVVPYTDQVLVDELEVGQSRSRPALWDLPASGGRSTPLALGEGSHRRAHFSPDGRRIVFQSAGRNGHKGWQIYTADADGRNQRRLTYPVTCEQDDAAPHCTDTAPAWSPSGDTIAFTRGGAQPCGGLSVECATIHLVPAAGGDARPLVRGWGASWSPDGRSLVYSAATEGGEAASCDRTLTRTCNGTLHVVRRDGTQPRSLGVKGSNARWSPDGSWIVFEGEHLDRTPHQVRLIRADGSDLHDVLPPGHDKPSWTADGRLLTVLEQGGQRDVWLSDADGTGLRRITDTPQDESFPMMRPRRR